MKTIDQYQKRLRELKVVILHLSNSPSNDSNLLGWCRYYHGLIKSLTENVSTIEEDSDRLHQAMISSKFEIDRAKQYLNSEK